MTVAAMIAAGQLAYDGARKAVASYMRREGVRVRRGEGAHALTAQYARCAIDETSGAASTRCVDAETVPSAAARSSPPPMSTAPSESRSS